MLDSSWVVIQHFGQFPSGKSARWTAPGWYFSTLDSSWVLILTAPGWSVMLLNRRSEPELSQVLNLDFSCFFLFHSSAQSQACFKTSLCQHLCAISMNGKQPTACPVNVNEWDYSPMHADHWRSTDLTILDTRSEDWWWSHTHIHKLLIYFQIDLLQYK